MLKLPQHSQTEVKDLLALANDESAFVRYFGMAMAMSAPYIYVSALPFAPTYSLILKQYVHRFPPTLTFEPGQLSHWPALEMTIRIFGLVDSVAFSPDGQRIASASNDHMVRVWDATAGQLVADPFTGHTDSVRSVAISSDRQRIASTSNDHTIRVWDATTGQVVAGPFIGHTQCSVRSVAFSPDG
jgi:WD40 repeat protein